MPPDWLPWLLQVNDSQFPSGAYAHSFGLEELVQSGKVGSADALEEWLQHQCAPALRAFELPWLMEAHAAAAAGDARDLRRMDDELDAWKLAAELRSASRQLGSRRLAMVKKLEPDPFLEEYAQSGAPCHHLTVCALELRRAPVAAAVCAFAYQTLSSAAYAAMKLLRLGQERAQAMVRRSLVALLQEFDPEVPPPARIGWFNPVLEIASMRHARARERLFIS